MRKSISLCSLISSLLASPLFAAVPARPQDMAGGDQPLCIPAQEIGQGALLPGQIEEQVRALLRGEALDASGMQGMHRRMTISAQGMIDRALRDRVMYVAAPAGTTRLVPQDRTTIQAARMEKGAFLGISTMTVDATLGEQLQLPRGMGLVVEYVEKGSPAEEAGIKTHDVVRKLDDQLLVNPQQLAVLVRSKKPGESVTLTVIRGGKEVALTAKLAEKDLPPLQTMLAPNVNGGALRAWPDQQGRLEIRDFQYDPHGANFTVHAENNGKSMVRTLIDDQNDIALTTKGGKDSLVVKDRAGKVIYEGELADGKLPEELPAEVRGKVEDLRKKLTTFTLRTMGPAGQMQLEANSMTMDLNRSDDEHVISLRVDEKGRSLSIKDAKTNQSIFEGPINTDEEFKKLPEGLQAKVKSLMKKTQMNEKGVIIKEGVEGMAR